MLSGHRDGLIRIHVLDGAEQLDAFVHGSLEDLTANDQAAYRQVTWSPSLALISGDRRAFRDAPPADTGSS